MKKWIFNIIQPDRANNRLSKCFDVMITMLILVSVASVFASTFRSAFAYRKWLIAIDAVVSIVFTIEYALRLWTAPLLYPRMKHPWRARLRYVFSALAIIDLLAILPFYLPLFMPSSALGLRAVRLLRLFRLFKLNRYFDAVAAIGEVISRKRSELLGSLAVICLFMLVASLLMYSVEHDAQPDVFVNAFSGLWWAVATLTTVGYGDIYPVTVAGRCIGALIALSGIAAVAIPSGVITSGLLERFQARKRLKKSGRKIRCPHCGEMVDVEEDTGQEGIKA